MPARKIEQTLAALSALRASPAGEARTDQLRRALHDKVNVVVAKAAALSGDLQERALIPQLCAVFERLLTDAAKTDPQCWGKTAAAKALRQLGHAESAIFLRGAQHVQMEPVWAGEEDTAASLRAICTLALLDCTDLTREDKLWHALPLLTESSASLRKDGALALESLAGREAALLLRIKARMGDTDPTVTGQVFESLLQVEGESAVTFVREFLQAPSGETQEEAALALGASRLGAAVEALTGAASAKRPPLSMEVLFRSLGISRHPQAVDFLLSVIGEGRPGEAVSALEALAVFRESSEVRQRIENAAARRTEKEVREAWVQLFGDRG